MFRVLTLNNISVAGLDRLPRDRYEVASELPRPDAILVRSRDMHGMEIPDSVKIVGRAGAGVNNIPVELLSERGIPVVNAPGANANAVKELVLAGMLLAARNIAPALEFVRSLEGLGAERMTEEMEAAKGRFAGFELPGRTLVVAGLGAVGVKVANAAHALGMKVLGYDPELTVSRAWQLSSQVREASSVGELLRYSDVVSLHVPLTESTRGLINAERIRHMRRGVTLLNFARSAIVDTGAIIAGLESGLVHAYVCDFPEPALIGHPGVVVLPHIGASTREAEEACAVMIVEQVRSYLEAGEVRNSVNFPDISMPRNGGCRTAVVNRNVPNMLGQISTTLAQAGLNILDMINRSRGALAYTLVDTETPGTSAASAWVRSSR